MAKHNIKEIFNELSGIADQDVKTIRERNFVDFFLPVFAGQMTQEESKGRINDWVRRVAGGQYHPVDVVDEQNKVLFQVPPLFDNTIVGTDIQGSGRSMFDVVNTVRQMSISNERAAQEYLAKHVDSRYGMVNAEATHARHRHQWVLIFARYNIAVATPQSPSTAATDAAPDAPASGFSNDSFDLV